jgi:hypothetical protein
MAVADSSAASSIGSPVDSAIDSPNKALGGTPPATIRSGRVRQPWCGTAIRCVLEKECATLVLSFDYS